VGQIPGADGTNGDAIQRQPQPSKGQPPSNGSTNGETTKPVKGAKPGNQLRPKKKR